MAKQLTVDQLREKAAQGLALNAEAQAAVEADDARIREEQREQAHAKRVTELLDLAPKQRAALAEAQAEVRSAIHTLVTAIPKAREARDTYEATARLLRSAGESAPQIPFLQVAAIEDSGLRHDLEALRIYVQSRF